MDGCMTEERSPQGYRVGCLMAFVGLSTTLVMHKRDLVLLRANALSAKRLLYQLIVGLAPAIAVFNFLAVTSPPFARVALLAQHIVVAGTMLCFMELLLLLLYRTALARGAREEAELPGIANVLEQWEQSFSTFKQGFEPSLYAHSHASWCPFDQSLELSRCRDAMPQVHRTTTRGTGAAAGHCLLGVSADRMLLRSVPRSAVRTAAGALAATGGVAATHSPVLCHRRRRCALARLVDGGRAWLGRPSRGCGEGRSRGRGRGDAARPQALKVGRRRQLGAWRPSACGASGVSRPHRVKGLKRGVPRMEHRVN